MADTGNFKALLGERCTFYEIRGVKTLTDSNGTDILKMIRKGITKTSDVNIETLVLTLSKRVDDLENFIKNMPTQLPSGNIEGTEGPPGKTGPQGPRGKDGKAGVSSFKDLEGVFLDGVDDGMVPVWSNEKGGIVFENF